MDQLPASPPKTSRVPWIALGCGGLGLLALIGAAGLGYWFFSKESPAAIATPAQWTIHADRDGVAGDAATAQVTVPAGAVDRNIQIALASHSPESRVAPGSRAVGRVWNVQVDGQDRFTFKKPVRLSVPLDRSLVKEGAAVSLSRWHKTRWQKVRGSRVEGERVVADVDHFSEYAPTQDEARQRERSGNPFLDADFWTGQVDISLGGSWDYKTPIHSSHWDISREASVRFRISMRRPVMPEGRGDWFTPGNSIRPEDQAYATIAVNDGGYRTDFDYDNTGNVYYYSSTTGGGSVQKVLPIQLKIDLQSGTYELSGISVQAGKVHVVYESMKPYEEPASVSFHTGIRKLPAQGGVIQESMAIPPSDLASIGPGSVVPGKTPEGTVTWTLTPGPAALAARIVAPSFVRRAEEVTLDGSASTGDIAEYLWTITIGQTCPVAAGRQTRLKGAQVKFHALWDFEAELEVRDAGGKRASTRRKVLVNPRLGDEWQTKFSSKKGELNGAPMKAGVTDLANSKYWKSHPLPPGTPEAGGIQFGVNQCAKHAQAVTSGHRLHTTDPDNKTCFEVGYDLVKVGDDGPFHGLFFVPKQSLEIDRIERVNELLLNQNSNIYVINRKHGTDPSIVRLRFQVTEHEKTHSTLMNEELIRLRRRAEEPSTQLEALIGLQLESTRKAADKIVADADLKLALASNDSKVKERLQADRRFQPALTIWLPLTLVDNANLDAEGKPTKRVIEVDVDLGPLWALGDE